MMGKFFFFFFSIFSSLFFFPPVEFFFALCLCYISMFTECIWVRFIQFAVTGVRISVQYITYFGEIDNGTGFGLSVSLSEAMPPRAGFNDLLAARLWIIRLWCD